ncbi:hypothetical protein [Gelria sp. Kuro-4]|uniref:hypothetical protein n=1 Tax=Gelria sp. Kuro-4 TaxID=2796927 RepID=UPI001BED730D|nr:hypothetical protein [Gelria sp. Kuro-4]BCV24617.1 hypothetical protein kuro4_13900 [Gelria sp. Kuro-4]
MNTWSRPRALKAGVTLIPLRGRAAALLGARIDHNPASQVISTMPRQEMAPGPEASRPAA